MLDRYFTGQTINHEKMQSSLGIAPTRTDLQKRRVAQERLEMLNAEDHARRQKTILAASDQADSILRRLRDALEHLLSHKGAPSKNKHS